MVLTSSVTMQSLLGLGHHAPPPGSSMFFVLSVHIASDLGSVLL